MAKYVLRYNSIRYWVDRHGDTEVELRATNDGDAIEEATQLLVANHGHPSELIIVVADSTSLESKLETASNHETNPV